METTTTEKPVLSAGLDDVWDGQASQSGGITLNDRTDRHNEPCMITSRQTNGSAYRKAAKVWEQVKGAKSMHEASNILHAAGCKLHYFCRLD